jgi:hypothetical protein
MQQEDETWLDQKNVERTILLVSERIFCLVLGKEEEEEYIKRYVSLGVELPPNNTKKHG